MKRWVASAVVAAALASAEQASAQAVQNVVLRNSFNPVGAGARGLGMGGAFIAVADDGTAASFNPAGLAQLRRSELALVGFGDRLTSTLTIPQFGGPSQVQTSESRHGAPDFAGLSVPFELGGRNLTLQLSYQRAVDLFGRGSAVVQNTVRFEDLGIDRSGLVDVIADIQPEQSGAFHTVSVAAGYQLTSRLSLGLSANYWIADWKATGTSAFRLVAAARPGQRPVEFYRIERHFDQDQSLRGLNLNVGFLLKYSWLSIGGVMRLPFVGDYNLVEGGQEIEYDLGRASEPRELGQTMTSRLHWPRNAGIGIAIRPLKGLTIAGDYTRSHWSRTFIEDVPDGALLTPEPPLDENGEPTRTSFTDLNFFDLLPASQTGTADTDQFRAGIEYLVVIPKVVIPLRVGAFQDRSPVTEFGTVEGRRIEGFTVGTGLNFSRLVFDVAYERRRSEGLVGLRFRGGEQVSTSLSPREKVEEDRIVASIIYRFGGDDPLKRLLRYLFVGKKEKGES